MNVGDICEIVLQNNSPGEREFCLILSDPEIVRVGAWGYQSEVFVLHKGKETRIPTHFLRNPE
jgi:hypothetical protein